MGAQSNEAAAIGFSYEIALLSLVSETGLHTLTSDSSKLVEFFTLPKLAVVLNRFVPDYTNQLPDVAINIIHMTPKGTQAIGTFVKIDSNIIVLIQVSTQASNNTGKVQSISGILTFICNMITEDMVIYP